MNMHPETIVALISHFHTTARSVRLIDDDHSPLSRFQFIIHSRLPSRGCTIMTLIKVPSQPSHKPKIRMPSPTQRQCSSSPQHVQGILGSTHCSSEVMASLIMAAASTRDYSLRILSCDRAVASSKASPPGERDLSPSFKFQYLLCSLRSPSGCLRPLPRLFFSYIFPSITCFRRPLFHSWLHYSTHIVYKKLRITQTTNTFIK
jgi:hypothetical protein